MIAKLKKVIFLGLKEEKAQFIKALQEAGIAHVDLPHEIVLPSEVGRELQKVVEVRKFLGRVADKKSREIADLKQDYTAICARQEELGQNETRLLGEISTLKKERALLASWGDFNPDDVALLRERGISVKFFRTSHNLFKTLTFEGEVCHVTHESETEVAFVVISAGPVDLGIPEEKLPAKSLSKIEKEILEKKDALESISAAYGALARQIAVLVQAEARLTDEYEYRKTLLNTESELDDKLFALTCWTPGSPEKLVTMINACAPGLSYLHFVSDPEPEDHVPVLLQNRRPFDSGEDLVRIYSHPNYADFDPSAIVLYAFVLFYGMIIGDAGYGILLLLLTMFLHWKVKSQSALWIRFRRLNYHLAASVIFFGLISASYFGILLSPENTLNKLMLLNLGTKEGQDFVMLVTILIGMVHISIALAIKFHRSTDLPSLGWIVVTWSGFFLIYSNGANQIAKWIMICGMGIVVLFTSSHRNMIIRLLLGINGALGVVQLFADVLSYLRLFALGLATMYMCQTFNMLAYMAYKGISSHAWIGVIPGLLILIVGHGINLVLGVMGGVVHGLRLNFLEWYRWCFEGDGLQFKPFRVIWKPELKERNGQAVF